MKAIVTVPANRNGHDIDITIAPAAGGGKLTVNIPTVARANACEFDVDPAELAKALAFLGDQQTPTVQPAAVRGGDGRERARQPPGLLGATIASHTVGVDKP